MIGEIDVILEICVTELLGKYCLYHGNISSVGGAIGIPHNVKVQVLRGLIHLFLLTWLPPTSSWHTSLSLGCPALCRTHSLGVPLSHRGLLNYPTPHPTLLGRN